jgi:hypothetical protein
MYSYQSVEPIMRYLLQHRQMADKKSLKYVLELICDTRLNAYSGWLNILQIHTKLFFYLIIQVVKVQIYYITPKYSYHFYTLFHSAKNTLSRNIKKNRHLVTWEKFLCVIIIILQISLHNFSGLGNTTWDLG